MQNKQAKIKITSQRINQDELLLKIGSILSLASINFIYLGNCTFELSTKDALLQAHDLLLDYPHQGLKLGTPSSSKYFLEILPKN